MGDDQGWLPIIDISALVKEGTTKEEKIEVGEKIDEACRRVGFFYVKNHGVDPNLVSGVFTEAKNFFDLDMEEKMKIKMNKNSFPRGYQVLGENITQKKRDWHEAIDFYRELPEEEKTDNNKQFHHPNFYPENPPSFRPTYLSYTQKMTELGEKIMEGLALFLGLDEDYFTKNFTKNSFWVMRVIGYPPLNPVLEGASVEEKDCVNGLSEKKVDVGVSCGEHTDYGWLTIVNQDNTQGALRVKKVTGEYIPANPIPGTFVMNIGDMLKIWSNGQYQSTLHKVVNEATKYRVSIPFFYEPEFDAGVEPHSLFVNKENPPQFERVVYGDHLKAKVSNNF